MTARFLAQKQRVPISSLVFVTAVASALTAGALSAQGVVGPVPSDGAFTCDFQVRGDFPIERVPPVIERDRIYMARRPGMLRKHIPLRPDPATGNLRSGGRYLFDTHDNAKAYKSWVEEEFILDGTLFFDREEFLDVDCHAWKTIGAEDFADIHDTQVVFRTERWAVPESNQLPFLKSRWPAIRDEAALRGLTSVWLLYGKQERLVTLVYFANRTAPAGTDFAGLIALESAPPLGALFADQMWTKTMDRTQFSLTIWFPNPFPVGDRGEPSLWPNSPILPEPGPNDGVCEPSRGENHDTAPNDCTPTCGDGVWDDDEDNQRCPSDVPHF